MNPVVRQFDIPWLQALVKEAVRRRLVRRGRLVRGAQARQRELAAAGGTQDHGTTFNYTSGHRVNT